MLVHKRVFRVFLEVLYLAKLSSKVQSTEYRVEVKSAAKTDRQKRDMSGPG